MDLDNAQPISAMQRRIQMTTGATATFTASTGAQLAARQEAAPAHRATQGTAEQAARLPISAMQRRIQQTTGATATFIASIMAARSVVQREAARAHAMLDTLATAAALRPHALKRAIFLRML